MTASGVLASPVQREPQSYKSADEIIDDKKITELLDSEALKAKAKDVSAVKAILQAAKERSFLTHREPGAWAGPCRLPLRSTCTPGLLVC